MKHKQTKINKTMKITNNKIIMIQVKKIINKILLIKHNKVIFLLIINYILKFLKHMKLL